LKVIDGGRTRRLCWDDCMIVVAPADVKVVYAALRDRLGTDGKLQGQR
jgi:hypothetical protein